MFLIDFYFSCYVGDSWYSCLPNLEQITLSRSWVIFTFCWIYDIVNFVDVPSTVFKQYFPNLKSDTAFKYKGAGRGTETPCECCE